jgi:hypothetical protein
LAVFGGLSQEVVRQAKRRLPTDAGETRELCREVFYCRHEREQGTGNGEPYRRGASVPGSLFPVPGFTAVGVRMGA